MHELTEMQRRCFGQYACNNQEDLHTIWMLAAVHDGTCAQRAQPYLQRAVSTVYKPGVDMFPGNEDTGSLAAWHVLSATGLYPLSPASGKWLITGSPRFSHVRLKVFNGHILELRATGLEKGPCVNLASGTGTGTRAEM